MFYCTGNFVKTVYLNYHSNDFDKKIETRRFLLLGFYDNPYLRNYNKSFLKNHSVLLKQNKVCIISTNFVLIILVSKTRQCHIKNNDFLNYPCHKLLFVLLLYYFYNRN